MRIGIFGGSFNPIHLGHLLLAETAREQFGLDRVVFVPTHQPPHKAGRELLPGATRLKLIQLAIHGNPAYTASDVELRREGVSYTIDTVMALRRRWPRASFSLLIGQDMLRVPWKDWAHLKRICAVAIAKRAGTSHPRNVRGVTWLTMPQIEISSSDIRRRLRAGRSIRYLVPQAVERYLLQRRLYRPATRHSA